MQPSTYAHDFTEALQNKLGTEHESYLVEAGRKYDKIICHTKKSGRRSVHAFVVRATGELVKPATWKAPQKDRDGLAVRYHLADRDGFLQAVEQADFAGSYLYK